MVVPGCPCRILFSGVQLRDDFTATRSCNAGFISGRSPARSRGGAGRAGRTAPVHLRHADAHAVLEAARRGERDRADTVAQQCGHQVGTRHRTVAYREEESVAHVFVLVFVIDDVETVTLEEFLDAVSAVCVFAGVPHEVQLAVRRRFEHGRQSVLSRVTCA